MLDPLACWLKYRRGLQSMFLLEAFALPEIHCTIGITCISIRTRFINGAGRSGEASPVLCSVMIPAVGRGCKSLPYRTTLLAHCHRSIRRDAYPSYTASARRGGSFWSAAGLARKKQLVRPVYLDMPSRTEGSLERIVRYMMICISTVI